MNTENRCAVCGKELDSVEDYFDCIDDFGLVMKGYGQYYVPMYEGIIVDPNTHEWAGFQSCRKCSGERP